MGKRKRRKTGLVPQESEFERLKKDIEQLKIWIAELSAEDDDLTNHICREIQADYDRKVGHLEYKASALMLKIERLKNTIELMQAKVNRREAPSFEEAEKQTEEAYRKYEEKLHQQAENMKQAEEYAKRRARQDEKNRQEAEQKEKAAEEKKKAENGGTEEGGKKQSENKENREEKGKNSDQGTEKKGSDRENNSRDGDSENETKHMDPSEELKHLYRKIVKRLHPDMNPHVTEEQKNLFYEAVEAYEEGNLERLREIAAEIEGADPEEFEDPEDGIQRLREIRNTLLQKAAELMVSIEWTKTHFPYIAKDFLEDEEAVLERQQELRTFILECLATIDELEERLEELKSEETEGAA